MIRMYARFSARAFLASDITVVVSYDKGKKSQAHNHDYYIMRNKSNKLKRHDEHNLGEISTTAIQAQCSMDTQRHIIAHRLLLKILSDTPNCSDTHPIQSIYFLYVKSVKNNKR